MKKNGLVNNLKSAKEKGLSILEALIATAVVGIGFVAIFQMVNYSVLSINNSSERTKSNYIVSMIAEGILGYRDTVGGVSKEESKEIYYKGGKPFIKGIGGVEYECKKFAEYYKDLGSSGGKCAGSGGIAAAGDLEVKKIDEKVCSTERKKNPDDYKSIHGSGSQTFGDAPRNKIIKWLRIITENRVVKCRTKKDVRSIKIFEQSPWGNGLSNTNITDEKLFMGRIQINMNDGSKRKYIYFQADYNLKQD